MEPSRASPPPRPRPAAPSWPLPLFARLERRIVDGERNGLEADLDAALDERPALEIINDTLLSA